MQDSPDKKGISLVRCDCERDIIRWDLDALAASMGNKTVERLYPIYVVFHHGQIRGYFHAIPQLVIYPAIHPDKISPREFIKIVKSLSTEMKRMVGNPIFMLCGYADKLGPKNMRRIRLKKAPETAYIYDEEAR